MRPISLFRYTLYIEIRSTMFRVIVRGLPYTAGYRTPSSGIPHVNKSMIAVTRLCGRPHNRVNVAKMVMWRRTSCSLHSSGFPYSMAT